VNFFYSRFSERYAQSEVAAGRPNVNFENALQATHQFVLRKYWSVTPQVDYIIHPGGVKTPDHALTLSLRTNLTF
jgi:carbohydrate-selective porin OprB